MSTDPESRLKAAALRVTSPRVAVLAVLDERTGHHDASTVAALARERLGALSKQAVYDVLDALVGAKLARRIQVGGSPARFEARTGDNHHHLVCRRCDAVVDVDCAVSAVPCLEPSDAAGFDVDEAEVTYWGLCPACLESRRSNSE